MAHVSQGGLLIKSNLSMQGHVCFIWFLGETKLAFHIYHFHFLLSLPFHTTKFPLKHFSISSSLFIMGLVASIQSDKDKQAMLLMFPKSLQAEWRLLRWSDELTMQDIG